ncbi:MAG: fructose-6-phosphate aldolase [Ruminococcaceae bacterium]|nr:fructose-6-phosphate aldolase [Oscillospiraceae bacterium]
MKLLIDDARIEKIKRIYEFYPVDGVTTNPSILAKGGRKPYDVLTEIRSFIGGDAELHVQVISRTAEDMVAEGHKITSLLGINTYIKIPTDAEGLKAMKILSSEGYHITATTIYTPMQAFLAAKVGADYAAPYVNRIDDLGSNGIQATRCMHDIFVNNSLKTQILAASFKNSLQIQELCEHGIGACTATPEVIEGLIKNAGVSSAIDVFNRDFESLCGENKTMLDCE